MKWERRVCSTEYGNEVRFECLDGLFCDVSVMVIWGNKLVRHLGLDNHGLEISGTLIVEDVMLWLDSCCLKAVHKVLVRSYHLS